MCHFKKIPFGKHIYILNFYLSNMEKKRFSCDLYFLNVLI